MSINQAKQPDLKKCISPITLIQPEKDTLHIYLLKHITFTLATFHFIMVDCHFSVDQESDHKQQAKTILCFSKSITENTPPAVTYYDEK